MKRFLLFSAAITAFTLIPFSSCSKKTPQAEKEITLVMAEINPSDTVAGRMDQAFKDKVEELSNGKIKIDLHCAGVLGDEKQVMKTIMGKDSSIHLIRGPANLASYAGGKTVKSSLLSIPYTFKNDTHFWKFAESPLAQEILDEPYREGLGVKGLFYAEEGLRHYFSTSKIEKVADLKQKKMRVSGAVLTGLANSFSSVPVEVKFSDLYAAFQTGQVEVAEQPLSNYLSNSFHEVAPYLILDGHMLGAISVMINAECWDSLSENQKKILTEAGNYASEYCKTITSELNAQTLKTLKESGVTVTEVSNPKEWQDACLKMRQDSAQIDLALYQKILDMAD